MLAATSNARKTRHIPCKLDQGALLCFLFQGESAESLKYLGGGGGVRHKWIDSMMRVLGHVPLGSYALAVHGPVLTRAKLLPGVPLEDEPPSMQGARSSYAPSCYALSSSSYALSCYAVATECPVLRSGMVVRRPGLWEVLAGECKQLDPSAQVWRHCMHLWRH